MGRRMGGPQRGHRRRLKPATTSWLKVLAAERRERMGRRMGGPQRGHHRRLKPTTTTLSEGLVAEVERPPWKGGAGTWPGRPGPTACLVLQIGGLVARTRRDPGVVRNWINLGTAT